MNDYERKARKALLAWRRKMVNKPSFVNKISKRLQTRINKMIPERVHQVLTTTIKQMVRGVLFGSGIITVKPRKEGSLEVREAVIQERINFYRKTAAIEGGVTGAGGILLGLADFPLLLSIKLKMLFDIAGLYGFDAKDYKERLYLLHIFQLAFCSHEQRRLVFLRMENWNEKLSQLPADINDFDWRTLQQEYRDYIDIAKMAQLIPVIGAPVGVVVNYSLIKKLGKTAMQSYRMRVFEL